MSKAPRPMKRTNGVSITPRRQQATPYPPPQTPSKPQRTTQSDNASRQTTIKAMGFKRGFSCLDSDDEEEEEEVVEPAKGVSVKKEFREAKEEKKERKSLVPHSPDSKPTSRTSRGASRAVPAIRVLASKSVNIARVTRSSTAQPTSQADHEDPDIQAPSTSMKPPNAPRKIKDEFKIPAPPHKPRPSKKTPRSKATVKVVDSPQASSSVVSPAKEEKMIESSFFYPDGVMRDIYVQGSQMVVKVRVEVPVYMDGSPSNAGDDVIAHITSSLEHLMVPFLHHLTFRHTAPITEKECYIRDEPVVYHMEHTPHGEGNSFRRTKAGDECLMWEDMLVITPYLIINDE